LHNRFIIHAPVCDAERLTGGIDRWCRCKYNNGKKNQIIAFIGIWH